MIFLKINYLCSKDKGVDDFYFNHNTLSYPLIHLKRRDLIKSRKCNDSFWQYTDFVTEKGIQLLKEIGYIKTTPKDVNELAKSLEDTVTGNLEFSPSENTGKNPDAVALGRLGGLKGGKARAAKLSTERRLEIARKAARVRWKPKDQDQSQD